MSTSSYEPSSLRFPDTYELVRLGYVARLQNGLTVDAKRDVTGDVVTRPYLRVANVQAGSLNLESVSEITVPRSMAQRSTLRPGDVLMTEGGDLDKLGRGTVWRGEIEGCLHQNHIFAIRPDPNRLSGRFLAYLTQSLYGRHYFESTGTRTTNLASTNSNKIQSFPLPLPPLDVQRRIADFLDAETVRIDDLTVKRRRMRELLALKRERVIESVLGLERRNSAHALVPLKYMVEAVSVGIVITPAKWYVDSGGVPALRGLNIKPGDINSVDLVQISTQGHAEHAKSRLQTGDVVVVRTGQAGAAAVVPPEFDGANCIDLIIVRPGEKIAPKYLEYVLNSEHARAQVSEHAVGSIQAHFNVGAMKQIPLPALSKFEQEETVARLDQAIDKIDRLRDKLVRQERLLAERRQALITAAVTGQFDVTTASGRNVTEGVTV
ncbi:restriction endonuclease subunit S [Streptomyces sp. NPDC003374]